MAIEKKKQLSPVEIIKENSNFLRGTIEEGLTNEITGAISEDDTQLIKFHGSYQQFDRATEIERKKQKLEPLYSFMIRIRLAGGITSGRQWLKVDELADNYANGTIKLTTRQAYQLHGVFKNDLKKTIQEINSVLMDTIAACGDVNRNIMNSANPLRSHVHREVQEIVDRLNIHLTPKTTAYHEIWLDNELVAGGEEKVDEEPLYGKTYLPRKFKIAFAIPPQNDTNVYANDLSFVAIEKDRKLIGFNVLIGGGMGMTFGREDTYPRLADTIGFISKDKVLQVSEEIIKIQRDRGNREDRKVARLKYTIDRLGLDWFKKELDRRFGWILQPARPFKFSGNGDEYGWVKGIDNKWYYTLFIEGGRIKGKAKEGLKEIAKIHDGDFRLTGNQNLIIGGISEARKPKIEKLLLDYILLNDKSLSGLRLNSIACVALNTCSLAHAEAETYLPTLITRIEEILKENNLLKDEIIIRMTGCPNGCGRPYLGEIGFVGKALGKYNMYLGAGFKGDRLNKLYKEMLNEEQIIQELKPIINDYSENRKSGERFGDFVIRKGYVKATNHGRDFHNK